MAILVEDASLYEIAHPEFYEALDRLPHNEDDFVRLARRRVPGEWRVVPRGLWVYANPPRATHPAQG
jgi:hypothetical protein